MPVTDHSDRSCIGCLGKKINRARPDSEFCSLHDPALAEQRRAWGGARHDRPHMAASVVPVGRPIIEAPKRAALAEVGRIVDSLLRVHTALVTVPRPGDDPSPASDPDVARAIVQTLKAAGDLILKEREDARKEAELRFKIRMASLQDDRGAPVEGTLSLEDELARGPVPDVEPTH